MNQKYSPLVEITTQMGCANNCVYCPQKLLLGEYYKENPNRSRKLTFEQFCQVLDNTPSDVTIVFAGMSEPFANPEAVNMVMEAHRRGYTLRIYTSLRGLTLADIDRLSEVPFLDFVVHLPDQNGAINLAFTPDYFEKVQYVATRIPKATFMVIGEPHEELAEYLGNRLSVTQIVLRGNNIKKEDIPKNIPFKSVEQQCKTSGKPLMCCRVTEMKDPKGPFLPEITVMLPDGTLILCCTDYGSKHVLGNLLEQPYDEIIRGQVMQKIALSMQGKNEDYLLCRECEWAIEYNEKNWKAFQICGTYHYAYYKHLRFIFDWYKIAGGNVYVSLIEFMGIPIICRKSSDTKKEWLIFGKKVL